MNELRVGKGKRKKEWRGSVFPLFDRADSTHRRADARRHRGGAAACFFNFYFFSILAGSDRAVPAIRAVAARMVL